MKGKLTKDNLEEMLRRMLRIRHFENEAITLHKNGLVPGSLHTSQGQEGEIVGACAALRLDDYMVGNHRSHGHPIGKGAKLRGLMAELLARKTGVCGGKGGSMHLADFSVGSLGETSIVGSGIPVAAGAALGAKMQGIDRVSLCFFGDGAAQEGTFHEGINMAAVWDLPAIFLCENNGYAVSTPLHKATRSENIADRAAGYGIPGIIVDGQDVLAVYEAVAEAVERARAGKGPSLIEAKTYRYIDHAANLGRDLGYRTEAEIEEWRSKRDPIQLFTDCLLGEFGFNRDEIIALEETVKAEVADAIAFAKDSPFPDPSEAWTDVYAPAAN
ncbi:thiamine pyrophosphate-dependent dehydrogenase E1 component subunit alpha [Pseudomonas sp. OTU5201]|uniref:thiamine pyrophosphate-dependent dehydrogenase E1 component subunit alpha n=1 Tax=Pseudomonas sp. OTU5201 TaxID=3043850 RepID=UPI00313AED6E